MTRRFLFAAAATALLTCSAGVNAVPACPAFATTASIRKTVAGGKGATLTLRVRNNNGGAAVNDAGLGLMLPYAFTVKSMKTSPRLASVPAMQTEGDTVA